jgi:thiopurine S-methyltransferase
MSEDWLGRWKDGRTGWHELAGNAGLKSQWPELASASRVLVPLCGKSPDLLWLAQHNHEVVGVELSDIAVRQFFADNDLDYRIESGGIMDCYTAENLSLAIYRGDYFEFQAQPFDALYDRGALVALPRETRHKYIDHTKRLLRTDAVRLIITLEYDQSIVQGPPFSVLPDELSQYWNDLERVDEADDIDRCPPKFRAAGLQDIQEVVWLAMPSAPVNTGP